MDEQGIEQLRAKRAEHLAGITALSEDEKKHYYLACSVLSEDRNHTDLFLDQITDRVIAIASVLNANGALPKTQGGETDRPAVYEQMAESATIAVARALAEQAGDGSRSAVREDGTAISGFSFGPVNVEFEAKVFDTKDLKRAKQIALGDYFTDPRGQFEIVIEAKLALSQLRVGNDIVVVNKQGQPVTA